MNCYILWLPWLLAKPMNTFICIMFDLKNIICAREIPASWPESSCRTWCLGQCVTLDSRSASKGFCNWTGVWLSFLAGNDFQLGCEHTKGGQSLSQEGDGGGGEVQEEGLELSPPGEQEQLLPCYGGGGSRTWRSVACGLLPPFKLVCFPIISIFYSTPVLLYSCVHFENSQVDTLLIKLLKRPYLSI